MFYGWNIFLIREKNFLRADWDILPVRFDFIEYSWDSKELEHAWLYEIIEWSVNTCDKINYKWWSLMNTEQTIIPLIKVN